MKKIKILVSFISLIASSDFSIAQCNSTLNATLGNNGMVTFNITGPTDPGVFYYQYDFGDDTLSFGGVSTNPVAHDYNQNGNYNVTLILTDSLGACVDTDYTTVNISNAVGLGTCSAAVQVDWVNGNIYEFVADVTSSGPAWYEYWSMPNGSHPIGDYFSYVFNQDGLYDVCLNFSDGNGCEADVCQPINVLITSGSVCNSYFYMFPDSNNSGTYLGFNLSTGSSLSYLWDFGDGTTSTLAYPTHDYLNPGFYLVCLTVNDIASCSDVYCDSSFYAMKIEGEPMSTLKINWAVGTENISPESSISIYNNPCSTCQVKGKANPDDLYITDILGRKVPATFTKSAVGYSINIIDNSHGIFLIKNSKTGEVLKFVRK